MKRRRGGNRQQQGGGGRGSQRDSGSGEGQQTQVSNSVMIEKGDTLSAIAAEYAGDWRRWEEIMAVNDLTSPNRLQVGQQLHLPADWPSAAGSVAPKKVTVPKQRPMALGASGDAVNDLQQLLNQFDAGLKVDGVFGPGTKAAVENFQRAHGLPVDGVMGANTVAMLKQGPSAPAAPDSYTIAGGDSMSSIAKQFTGDARRWQELWVINKGAVPNPDRLKRGVVLRLPLGWGGADAGQFKGRPSGGTQKVSYEGGPYTRKYGDQSAGNPLLQVEQGQMTFDAEGREGGAFHTRGLHWPGGHSGVTLGRGFDMGFRTQDEVLNTLFGVGVDWATASAYSQGAGLRGPAARQFVFENKGLPEISLASQKRLFDEVYSDLLDDVVRISERGDVAGHYGHVNWTQLNPAILDLVVDLRFRGDYTPTTRAVVQPLMVANDVGKMSAVMSDTEVWKNVPKDRRDRRIAWMQEAATAHGLTSVLQDANKQSEQINQDFNNVILTGAMPKDTDMSEEAFRQRVLSSAYSHIGKPYAWGADGPSMFDCSGFALYVLRNDARLVDWGDMNSHSLMKLLPRTNDPKPGDLVFYTSGGRAQHVEFVSDAPEQIGARGGGKNTHGDDPDAKVEVSDMNSDKRARQYGSIQDLIQKAGSKA